jgi:ubiquinone/menaquinone biosynthesis C-methylase UbiE
MTPPAWENQNRADRDVDTFYRDLRGRYGRHAAQANGYLTAGLFRNEQRAVLERVVPHGGGVVDVAGGSGLMLKPLAAAGVCVTVLDFNADACRAAAANGLQTVRGDAYVMPFADATVDHIVNCQFLNQQTPDNGLAFVQEVARVLRPGGRAILVWRHAGSALHRTTDALVRALRRAHGRPVFPQHMHDPERLSACACDAALVVRDHAVTIPYAGGRVVSAHGAAAAVLGASQLLVLEKPDG